MLNDIINMLRSSGVDIGNDVDVDANIWKSHNLNFYIMNSQGNAWFAKVEEAKQCSSLKHEYEVLMYKSKTAGFCVPEPICLKQHIGYEFLLMHVIDSFPVRYFQDILGVPTIRRKIGAALTALDSEVGKCEAPVECLKIVEGIAFDRVKNYIKSKEVREILSRLTSRPQHGDFSRRNIGIRKNSIVIYDWEDFGRADIPGYDLTVLLGSFLDHNPEKMMKFVKEDEGGQSFCNEILSNFGMSTDDYIKILPVYYAIFWKIKEDFAYAAAIQERALRTSLRFIDLMEQ